jgi:hypothetical protein
VEGPLDHTPRLVKAVGDLDERQLFKLPSDDNQPLLVEDAQQPEGISLVEQIGE